MIKRDAPPPGLLIVDKPGLPMGREEPVDATAYDLPTSHDVVQRVRRWSGQRRIGHTGTLDPMASGVLVLCLGQATRLVEYYQGHDKVYLAEVTLGRATDTYDALGQVTDEQPIPRLTPADIEAALARFRGEIWQTPPIYSAIKRGGESLHRKARRGEDVTIEPRPITIHELSLVDLIGSDRLRLRVKSSAGAYMRSLAHDLGAALGTAAHLSALRREAAGGFTLADAVELDAIQAAAQTGRLTDLLLPPGDRLQMPWLTLDEESSRRLGYGQRVVLNGIEAARENAIFQAYNEEGRFLGVLRCLRTGANTDETDIDEMGSGPGLNADESVWKAEKWFAPQA
jgi:tRNA pseudouridine55 synthase